MGDVSALVMLVDAAVWDRKDELEALIFDELYREFGVDIGGPWWSSEPGSVTAVALTPNGGLVGSARLLPPEGTVGAARQVRQVAVARGQRSTGVGRELMAAVERRARDDGASGVVLHARDTAIEFYERLGYRVESEPFVSELTGIVHRTMRKVF